MILVDIVSGFLGSGKTTLIKKMVKEKLCLEELAIIENEFGEIGIDGTEFDQGSIQIREITAGCICCSLQGSFVKALVELADKYLLVRIIIEPSGIGKLSVLRKPVDEFIRLWQSAKLNMQITVVDVLKYNLYMQEFGDFYLDQIAYANTVVLSKTQMAEPADVEMVMADIQKHNTNVSIITTPWEQINAGQIISIAEKKYREAGWQELLDEMHNKRLSESLNLKLEHNYSDNMYQSDITFNSWGKETFIPFNRNELKKRIERLQDKKRFGRVIRAKGVLQDCNGNWIKFSYVPGEINIEDSLVLTSGKICVIGYNLNHDELNKLFDYN